MSVILGELHMRIRLQKTGTSLNFSQGNEVFMTLLYLARNTSSRINETKSTASRIQISDPLL